MGNTITSPNMSLPVPVVGVDPGPDWASQINNCLTLIDAHNHSPGLGVQITPNGLNINADLPFGANNATNLRAARFFVQSSPIANAGVDIGELYVSGNELYYNDVTGGNQVQLTSMGSVNAGPGSITGLPSGTASATFSAGTFIWQASTNSSAVMDCGWVIVRNLTPNANGVTLAPVNALASSYALTLPTKPASTQFLTIDSSGVISGSVPISLGITASNIANATITGSKIAASTVTRQNQVSVGQQISASCGNFSTANTSDTAVTNLSVTIATTGRPVVLVLISDGSANFSYVGVANITNGTAGEGYVSIYRGATKISYVQLYQPAVSPGGGTYSGTQLPPGAFGTVDTISAGTYTYTVQAAVQGSPTTGKTFVQYCQLVAYEL